MVLKFINEQMSAIGIPYEFYEWTSEVKYPYFVGEFTEEEPMTEDGLQETTFMLTGFTRDSWLTLENAKDRIENYFNRVSGKTVITDNMSAVAIFYAGSMIVPTNDAELKSIQINLHVKEWRVN